jgi:3-deoxy-D-manno-octulosonic-acid transferase
VQGEPDAKRFVDLGAVPGRVKVCGNLKFDVQLGASILEQGAAQRRHFSVERPVFIAASTHHGEEAVVLEAFRGVLESEPHCLLILAPRHPERAGTVEEMCRRAGLRTVRRTGDQRPAPGAVQVFLLDTLGELPVFYAAADVAFVGGSLVPLGGHNLLEPASLGLPLLCGPHVFNFAEAAERLESAGALSIVADAAELRAAVVKLLGDANLRHARGECARRVFRDNRGSADLVARLLQPLLHSGAVGQAGAG